MEATTSTLEANCWFCNNNCQIKEELIDGWFCKKCEQYNGFDADGGYNIDVPGQIDLKLYKTDMLCEPGEFLTADSLVLCRSCSNNQVLKVRQLANFMSISEENHDYELENYKHYLEQLYKLCQPCEIKVRECLSQQDTLLKSKMSSDQLKKLELLKAKKFDEALKTGTTKIQRRGSDAFLLSTYAVFFGCLLLSMIRVLICLRLYAAAVVSMGVRHSDYYSIFMIWIVNAIPGHSLLHLEEYIICSGAGLCLCGLLLCGKHNLYPEDSVHLSLWLVSLFTTIGSPALLLPWMPPGSALTFILSVFTSCLALLSCIRKRRERFCNLSPSKPRKISRPDKRRRKVPEVRPENAGDSPTSFVDNKSGNNSHQDSKVELEVMSYFEDVCQDLQTFSLGLCKKSNSNSSIWSIPAVVTSSTDEIGSETEKCTANRDNLSGMCPDSTSDGPVQPRSVLSPSRLGFISFDSPVSRSPSPWDPILVDDSVGSLDQHKNMHPSEDLQAKFESNINLSEKSSVKQPATSKNNSMTSNSSERNLSQHIEVATKAKNSKNHSLSGSVSPEALMEPVRLRRSYRLAGRLPKPWPLRKSFSCNNAVDLANRERAGASARFHYLPHLDTQKSVPEANKTKADNIASHSTPQKIPTSPESTWPGTASSLNPWVRDNKPSGAFSTYRSAGGSHQTSGPKGFKEDTYHNKLSMPERANVDNTAQSNWSDKNVEFSDDEAMDIDQPSTTGQHQSKKGSRASGDEVSWKWIIIGAVIGTSVTCNVFLLILGFWRNT